MKKIGREVLFLNTSEESSRIGESTFARLGDGSILFAYTNFCEGSGHDHGGARLDARISRDDGETWGEPFVLLEKDAKAQNYMSPGFVRMSDGRLGIIYDRKSKTESGGLLCMPYFRTSSDDGKTWSEQVCCLENDGYYVYVNDSAVCLSGGRIVVPISHCGTGDYKYFGGEVFFAYSDDNGKTWQKTENIKSPYADNIGLQEPGIYEFDGGVLWSWMRTAYGFQYQSFSRDGGKTWSAPVPNFRFPSPDSPMRIKKVGKYLVSVFNPLPYNCMSSCTESWLSPKRTPLAITFDGTDGKIFSATGNTASGKDAYDFNKNVFLLEDDFSESYCYPAICEVRDGFLVAYYHSGGTDMCLSCTKMVKVKFDEAGLI